MGVEDKVFEDPLEAAKRLHAKVDGGEGWYAGVANDPERKLADHAVDPDEGEYDYVECAEPDVALGARATLHKWGYEGGPTRTEDAALWVYVYAVTDETREIV
jgi:hypothetical protein